jgi:hypothetical protein
VFQPLAAAGPGPGYKFANGPVQASPQLTPMERKSMESVRQSYQPSAKPQQPDPPDEILRDLLFGLAIVMLRRPEAYSGLHKLQKQISRIRHEVLREVRQ